MDRRRALAACDGGLAVFFEFGAIEVFRDGRMRSWLAGECEVAA